MSKAKWPEELPVFESIDDVDYYVIGVGVGNGYIEVGYPCSQSYTCTNELGLGFFGEGRPYKPTTRAAREMIAIAKAGAR